MPWMYPSDMLPPAVLIGSDPVISSAPLSTNDSSLARRAEPVRLELHQHGDREAVVELGDVDVGGSEAGPRVQRRRRRLGRHRQDRAAGEDREHRCRPARRASLPWATARMTAGGWRRSRARSVDVTTTAQAPSVSRQKSNRRSGSEIMRPLK